MSSATIKKLKDVNLYTIDELKELLGMSTEKGFYTTDDISNIFDIQKSKYPNLARQGGFLDKAMAAWLSS